MSRKWLHEIVHYVTWGQDLATCGCQVERSNFGCLGSSLVWITGRDAGVRPIVADQPKLEPLLATRRRGFRTTFQGWGPDTPAPLLLMSALQIYPTILFVPLRSLLNCFKSSGTFVGGKPKLVETDSQWISASAYQGPRWLWQRLWEGEIIPTTDINLFLCLKTQPSTTQSICGNCEDNNS